MSLIHLLLSILKLIFDRFTPLNPFRQDTRKPRKPYIHDQVERDQVLRQEFKIDKVPADLDAVIIGSGIGGLAAGVILAKAGKKVLVLEQADKAGGCCSTFVYNQDIELDVGLHYVGEMAPGTIYRTFFDQITDGQLEWEQLDDEFDLVVIGSQEKKRTYAVATGVDNWRRKLKNQFPRENLAIETYFSNMEPCQNALNTVGVLKCLPLWIVKFLIWSRILRLVTNLYTYPMVTSSLALIKRFTKNPDLRTMMTYNWGNIGALPSESLFSNPALMCQHFMTNGAFYPVGGSSEIPLNMIPIIERAGGRVLTNVRVKEIIFKAGKVSGVHVDHGDKNFVILCTTVISTAGVHNTMMRLVPKLVATQSYYYNIVKTELNKPTFTAVTCNVILNGTAKELGIKKQNIWAYSDTPDSDKASRDFLKMTISEVMDMDFRKLPACFISFNSAKDPQWKTTKNKKYITIMQIITAVNWEWFKEWEGIHDKGEEYKNIKENLGQKLVNKVVNILPQLEDKIVFTDVSTPLTYNHFLGRHEGALYGLEHSMKRVSPWMQARLRPKTDLPGLYLAGQDITSGGVVYSSVSGILAAQAVLARPVIWDLYNLHTSLYKKKVKNTETSQ